MFCKFCGSENADTAKFCVVCGKNQYPDASEQKNEGSKKTNALLIALVVLLSIALLVVLTITLLPKITGQSDEQGKSGLNIREDDATGDMIQISEIALSEGNPYEYCYQIHGEYVLPDSDNSYKCYGDIVNLTPEERYIAAQEIYARQGKTFSDRNVQEYFDNRAWYTPGGTFKANAYEQANLDLLEIFEAVEDGSWNYSGNPYIRVFNTNGDYANAYSNTRYLTANELKDLSDVQLTLMRNEIFARRGFVFSDHDLRMYFYSKPWYQPTVAGADFDSSVFNEYEYSNVKLIKIYEKRALGVPFSQDNPYRDYYDSWRDYVFYNSDSVYLNEYDITGMTLDQLCLARNEILARHGYTFKDEHLLEYFLQFDWYLPNTPEGDSSSIKYNEVELANVSFLKEREKVLKTLPDLSKLDTSLTYKVSTEKFSAKLPAYFKTYANIEKDSSGFTCYENLSRTFESYSDGKLFTVYCTKEDYTFLPAYRYLGTLENADGDKYDLIVEFPTDFRASMETIHLNNKMSEEFKRIEDTITGEGGYTFYPA